MERKKGLLYQCERQHNNPDPVYQPGLIGSDLLLPHPLPSRVCKMFSPAQVFNDLFII